MSTHTLTRPSTTIDQDILLLSKQQDINTRRYFDSMIDNKKPEILPDVGRWLPLVERVEEAYNSGSNGNKGQLAAECLNSLIQMKKFPGLEEMFLDTETIPPASPQPPALQESNQINFPALPQSAQLSTNLSEGACNWLDEYVRYSKLVSPEGYEDFHEACGLWILSVIAGRRVKLPLNKQYTPLMIALVARTSLYAKSVTAGVAVDVLYAAGLKWLLGSDETTPQKLLTDMAGQLPKDYGEADTDKKYRIEKRLSMAAQRGWYYDELGQLLKAMSKDGASWNP